MVIRNCNRGGKRQRGLSNKLKKIDGEFTSFYKFCKNMGFSKKEMDGICSPLRDVIWKQEGGSVKRGLVLLLALVAACYALNQPAVTAHISAVGRLAMVKILPLWDWRHLFYTLCVIENPSNEISSLTLEDCSACESLENIERINLTSYKILAEDYLSRDTPVVVLNAMETSEVLKNDLDFANITEVYIGNDKLRDTVPCTLTTNIRTGYSDFISLLHIIQDSSIKRWFVHWRNCDIYGVKALRKFYKKISFLPSTTSPAHINWVFMSSHYSSKLFKKLELDTGLALFMQLRGESDIRLTPGEPCIQACPHPVITLQQGQILVLKNYMWNMEYRPAPDLDNIAILTETIWDRFTTNT